MRVIKNPTGSPAMAVFYLPLLSVIEKSSYGMKQVNVCFKLATAKAIRTSNRQT